MKLKLIAVALMFVALAANAKTLAEAIEEGREGKFTCFINSEVQKAKDLIAWQSHRIMELETELAARK